MRASAWVAALLVGLPASRAIAVDPPSPSPTPAAAGDPRLVFSTNGARLTGGIGAAGGSAIVLGDLGGGTALGAGVEYQTVSNAHWTLGEFTGSVAPGLRTHLYLEAHVGAGDLGKDHAFHYSLVAAGLLEQLTSKVAVQLEERYIDVDTVHGNLPKVGLSLQATKELLASVSYASVVGGNLGAHLGTVRIDYTGRSFSALAGISGGQAALVYSPCTSGPCSGTGLPLTSGLPLHEGFAGVGKALGRTDWLLIGDYQDVSGTKRIGASLTCTVHLHASGQSP